ncbi:MAG TPA: cysteine desulfurase NifS [Deltaproteobacteria bacterium]|nr:cysteine desulfurase NifS [Deltaproteobacteria bacterium]
MIYFDNNATTPLLPEVAAVMREAETCFGNAGSVHAAGRDARRLLNQAREEVAACFRAPEAAFVFTSGATEALNAAMLGIFLPLSLPSHLIVSQVEHAALLKAADFLEGLGVEVSRIGVDAIGRIDPEAVAAELRPHTRLIAVMFANNEIGNLYPVKKIGELARSRGVAFLCDAVQAVGRYEIDLSLLPIDLLAASAHKFHGPKGVGFLYCRPGLKLTPWLHGGRQERGRRAGTENISGIVGLAAALKRVRSGLPERQRRIAALRDRLQAGLAERIPEVVFNGDAEFRTAGTLNFRTPQISGETLLMNLDMAGIAVSVGAACDSGSLEPSHVLTAMGQSEAEALEGLRVSLSELNTEAEVEEFLNILPKLIEKIRMAA